MRLGSGGPEASLTEGELMRGGLDVFAGLAADPAGGGGGGAAAASRKRGSMSDISGAGSSVYYEAPSHLTQTAGTAKLVQTFKKARGGGKEK